MKCITKLKAFSVKRQGLNKITGCISLYNRGGGHKKKYRSVDFQRKITNIPCFIKFFEYDPVRSAFLAFITYSNGLFCYILAPQKLAVGTFLITGDNTYPNLVGNFLPLYQYKSGVILNSLETNALSGASLIRAAGNYCFLIQTDFNGLSVIRFKNGSLCLLSKYCRAVFGSMSNSFVKNDKFFKAGQSRWCGIRPSVRGVAKNPVDHPHGGNTSPGTQSISFSHVLSKGFSTSRRFTRQTKRRSVVSKHVKFSI